MLLVSALLASLALAQGVQEEPDTRPLVERVDEAIDAGIAYLREAQLEDGSWRYTGTYRTGASALAVYALLQCGVEPDDEAVLRALTRLALDDPGRTYDTACLLMALAAHDPDRNRDWIDELAASLVTWQNEEGDWGYPGGADLSNTQYAVLGLRAAAYAGADVPVLTWQRLGEAFEAYSFRNGSYGYRRSAAGGSASMTAAGVSSMAICDTMLAREDALPNELFKRFREERERGLNWMAQNLDGYLAGVTGVWGYYSLYGVERTGALTGTVRLGGRDWYAEGAEQLLAQQDPAGSWNATTVQTCFALLFLSRATSKPPKTGRYQTRSGKAFATTDPGSRVRLAATGENPVTLWISGWGDDVLAEWEWPGERGRGPHVERVVYMVDDRIVGEPECDPEQPAEAQRFAHRHGFRAAGTYRLRARVHLAPPPADRLEEGEPPPAQGSFWSPSIELEVDSVEPAWLVEQRGDRTPNLLLSAFPRITATSYVRAPELGAEAQPRVDRPRGDFPPAKAADGRLRTPWLADPEDPLPRLSIELGKPQKADELLVSHARAAPYQSGFLARALTVEVTINGGERQTVRMYGDERRKGKLVLERPVNVRSIELAIPQKAPGGGYQCVGLAEVELRRRR